MSAFDKAWKVVKRDGLDYGQRPIKESEAMTHGTELPSLKTMGVSQKKISNRKSAGKSPTNIGRVSGAPSAMQSRKNSTDHKKTVAEVNVDATLRNAGAKGQR